MKENNNYQLTIIIPVYNEQHTILDVLDLLHLEESLKNINFQVIIIDDGSSDNTNELLLNGRYANKNNVKIIVHEKNIGKGAAIRSAQKHILGEYVVIKDADLENSVGDIKKLLDTIKNEELLAVYGSRCLEPRNNTGQGNPLYFWGGQFITLVTNLLFKQKLTDAPTCYKMFKADFFQKVPLKEDGFEFCQEITAHTAKQGVSIKEIPIMYYPRTKAQGKKLRGWKHGFKALWILLKMRLL